jgi:tetrapyrrole methylase family protein / MazG family protein
MDNSQTDFNELLSIIRTILSDEGCPISKRDTFETQLNQIREELVELEEAISKDNKEEINEELGHVLFDVLYLGVLGENQDKVDLNKVFKELNWSIKYRFPHVFEGIKCETEEEIKNLRKERKDSYHKMKKEGKLPI